MTFKHPAAQPNYISVDILRITQIPKRSVTSRVAHENELQRNLSQEIPGENMAKTKECLPISSTVTIGNSLVLSTTTRSETSPNFSSRSNDPVIRTTKYVTFPKYQRSAKSKRHIVKKCAKKIGIYFLNVGNSILSGLEAIGSFYASSEHKWQCEYAPLEPLSSQPTVWEAIHAADKAKNLERARKSQRKSSWSKDPRRYWKSIAAQCNATSSTKILSQNDDQELPWKAQANNTIPSVSEQLLSRIRRRPQYMQSSNEPCHAFLAPNSQRIQSNTEPNHPSRIPLPRQRRFSPPHGRMYPLERQPRRHLNDSPSYGQQACSSAHPPYIPQQQNPRGRQDRRQQGKVLTEEQKPLCVEEDEDGYERNQDIGTPWSGLETVEEEQPFFGTSAAIAGDEEEHDRDLSRSRTGVENEAAGTMVKSLMESERAIDCDGFEAGGEFCLRHESCAREAMALGNA